MEKEKKNELVDILLLNTYISLLFIPSILPFFKFGYYLIGMVAISVVTSIVYSLVIHYHLGENVWRGWTKLRAVVLFFLFFCIYLAWYLPSYYTWIPDYLDLILIMWTILDNIEKLLFSKTFPAANAKFMLFIVVQVSSVLTFFAWHWLWNLFSKNRRQSESVGKGKSEI